MADEVVNLTDIVSIPITNGNTFGRKCLYTPYAEVDGGNIVEVLNSVLPTFLANQSEIRYLFDYHRGKQPILNRVKTIRENINNKIVENRASEIVAFKAGYLLGEPIQYVAKTEKVNSDMLNQFNSFMESEDKDTDDKEIAGDRSICGTAYRMCLPIDNGEDENRSPFHTYRLDPATTGVIYSSQLGNEPVLGFTIAVFKKRSADKDGNASNYDETHIYCYSPTEYFELIWGTVMISQPVIGTPHTLGMIPIIEYPNNFSRLGDFEIVMGLLNGINTIDSNRIDGVEQLIQSLLVFTNVDITSEDIKALYQLGALKLKSTKDNAADVKFITQQLDQNGVQVLKNDLYASVLTICGMPNRNGGSSTSDTGSAVILRDGWSAAESRAKDSELIFKKSEHSFIKLALKCFITITYKSDKNAKLDYTDIDVKFTRRNFENINTKVQAFTQLMSVDKLAPRLAFNLCGLFPDPTSAYVESKAYYDKLQAEAIVQALKNGIDASKDGGGTDDENKVDPKSTSTT